MSDPKSQKTQLPGGVLLRLRGKMDADFDGFDLMQGLSGTVVIDLAGISRVTSFGVGRWIDMVRAIPPTTELLFINVTPPVLSQFNLVAGFAGPGNVVSLQMPYLCDWCDHETDELVDLRERYELVLSDEPPTIKCPECGADAEFDDDPGSYFSFVRGRPKPAVSPLAARMISGELGDAAQKRPFLLQKEVRRGVTGLWLSGFMGDRARFKRSIDGLEGTVVVVVAGITGANDRGASKFEEVLDYRDADLWFARIPVPLLNALTPEQRQKMSGRLVSTVVPVLRAGEKSHHSVTMDSIELHRLVTEGRVTSEEEEYDAQAAVPREITDSISTLMAPIIPKEVADYLSARGTNETLVAGVDASGMGGAPVTAPETSKKFSVVKPLGRGGMADVYLANQVGPEGFKKQIALKWILPELSENERFVRLFLREARVAASVNHPNVVQIYDLGEQGGRYYIAMEYVDGWDLRTVTRAMAAEERKMPVGVALRIMSDAFAGLHAAHTCLDAEGNPLNIVHRDVSPHNILVARRGGVKVSDFGVSKASDEGEVKTRTGQITGKLPYMAPEQINPDLGAISARSDIFAGGIVLYELLTGKSPFVRRNEYATMRAVLGAQVPALTELRKDTPAPVVAIVERAMSRDPAQRFQTAADVHLALESAIQSMGRPVTAAAVASFLDGIGALDRLTNQAPRGDSSSTSSQTKGPPSSGSEGHGPTVPDTQIIPPDDPWAAD